MYQILFNKLPCNITDFDNNNNLGKNDMILSKIQANIKNSRVNSNDKKMKQLFKLCCRCCDHHGKNRPHIDTILDILGDFDIKV